MSLWGICAFFNPAGSVVRVENFKRFARSARAQGLKLLVVELTYGTPEIHRESCDLLIQLSSGALCWQKERLFKVGLKWLPPDCTEVAWLDGDVLFENHDWVRHAEKALANSPVVQLFDQVYDGHEYQTGMGFCQRTNGACLGHPGFAWAARRGLLDKHGFYDRCIVGGGDAVMSWANYGVLWPGHNRAAAYFSPAHLADIERWSADWYADVKGQVGYVEGTLVHLPHGPKANRQYMQRTRILKDAEFRPEVDVIAGPSAAWHWGSDKPGMHLAIKQYFDAREPQSANAVEAQPTLDSSEEHQVMRKQ